MSSSLIQILSLMEQAIKEQEPSGDDEQVAFIKKKPSKISNVPIRPKKDILNVDQIVSMIYSRDKKKKKNLTNSLKTIKDFNSENVSKMQPDSESISNIIGSYFEIPDVITGCKDVSDILNRSMINAAYQQVLSLGASTAGFENEKLVAYLLNGKQIPVTDDNIADIEVNAGGETIGISLKTKVSPQKLKGSYRNLLSSLGIPYKYYETPLPIGEAMAQEEAKSQNFKYGVAKQQGKIFIQNTKTYEKIFYVIFEKSKTNQIVIHTGEVTEEDAIEMAGEGGYYDEETGIFHFNSAGLSNATSSATFLGSKAKFSELGSKIGISNFATKIIDLDLSKKMADENDIKLMKNLRKTLNVLNAYVGIMIDSITNYSIEPNEKNLTTVKESLENMAKFQIQTQQNCQSPIQGSLQEAISVGINDIGQVGQPAAVINQDRRILDNKDIKKVETEAIKTILSDKSQNDSKLNYVVTRMKRLVDAIPAVPENSREAYKTDLFASIDRIYNYWKERDGSWFLNAFTQALRSFRNSDIDKLTNKYMDAAELSDEELEARQAAQDAALAAQAEKEQEAGQVSVTSPTFKTSRLPSNLQDYNAVMDRMFGKSTSLRQRVQDLEQLGVLFGKSEEEFRKETEEMNELDFFSKVVMMDYLVEIAKGFDSTAGRYLLEYLLAVVAKGRVTGADLGESGMAGAVDFRSAEGFGSSKFLSSYDDALQSIKSFKKGETVTYVVAVREGNPRELQTRAPSPLKLQSIKMHIFDITRTGSSFDIEIDKESGGKGFVKLGNYPEFFQAKEGVRTHLNIGKIAQANQSNAYTIPLVFTTEEGTKTYRQMMSTSLGKTKQELLTIVKDLFDGLKKADEQSRKYVVTGDPEDGGKAMESIDKSSLSLIKIRGFAGEESKFDLFAEQIK